MCARVVELGRLGKSRKEMAADLGVRADALARWAARFPEFAEAMEFALACAQAWWEEKGRLGIHDRNFNTAAYILTMRNRFRDDYRDQRDKHDA
jgi:hypothetical protein